MNSYTVKWTIDVEADTPEQAAEAAMEIMVNPSFPDAFFEVTIWDSPDEDNDQPSVLVKVPYPVVR